MPNKYPLVTVGIPTYNRADGYLREALESAISQTYPNVEIIVADNCSPDNTKEVVAEYRDKRIWYYRHEVGIEPNDNFNFCLAKARGDYFLLLHDDDKIDQDFIEICLKTANYRTKFGLVTTGVRKIDANGMVIGGRGNPVNGLCFEDFFLGWFRGQTSIYLCSTLFNTAALKNIGGLKSKNNLYQDVMAIARVARLYERIDIDEIKASARQHGAKLTHVANVMAWCEDSMDLLKLICDLSTHSRSELNMAGEAFLLNSNYSRASKIRSLTARIEAYIYVYRAFGGKRLPSVRMVIHSTAVYRLLRQIKRKVLGKQAWAD
jgi:glycosyltransferase involved in cell wall biosynthesis